MCAAPVLGCATTTPGARPHDVSEERHQAAAERHERSAEAHSRRFDPDAVETTERCGPKAKAVQRNGSGSEICWTSVTNPTEEHRRADEDYRRAAADHRAASAALRETEATACAVSPTTIATRARSSTWRTSREWRPCERRMRERSLDERLSRRARGRDGLAPGRAGLGDDCEDDGGMMHDVSEMMDAREDCER